MQLPNRNVAEVPEGKISGYLLSELHPIGRGKARFFIGLGFRADQPEPLRRALLQHARINEVSWFIEAGQHVPRSITAYPLRGMPT